jgi:hypothetical protein
MAFSYFGHKSSVVRTSGAYFFGWNVFSIDFAILIGFVNEVVMSLNTFRSKIVNNVLNIVIEWLPIRSSDNAKFCGQIKELSGFKVDFSLI